MKETFLIIIPHEFVPSDLEENMEVGDLSMYKVEDTMESLEERLTSMVMAGLFDSFIILPMSDFDQIEDLSLLENQILKYRMEMLANGTNE